MTAMIGNFGDIAFEVSSEKVITFSGMRRDSGSRFESHNIIGQKPRAEYVGLGLDTVEFEVLLNGNLGVTPRSEMNRWLEYARSGEAEILVIGNKALGVDRWTVQSVSQMWETVMNTGELISGKVRVKLQEYVSASWPAANYYGNTNAESTADAIKRLEQENNRIESVVI